MPKVALFKHELAGETTLSVFYPPKEFLGIFHSRDLAAKRKVICWAAGFFMVIPSPYFEGFTLSNTKNPTLILQTLEECDFFAGCF